MSAQKGSSVLIKVGDGAPSETFTTLGGLQLTRFALNNQPIDATHLGSGAWRQLLGGAGAQSITLTVAGIFEDSASEETVRAQAFAGSVNHYEFDFGGDDKFAGPFLVSSYERSGEVDGAETYAIGFESAGALTVTLG